MGAIKSFQDRFSKAKSNKQNWQSQLDDAYDMFCPNRNDIATQSRGNRRMTNLYDSVGVEALQEFSNNVKTNLLPSSQKWSVIKVGSAIEAEVMKGIVTRDNRDEVARQLEILSGVIFSYIWNSNFDQASHEAIQDMAISLGALLCLDTGNPDKPISFTAVSVNQLYPEHSSTGSIETVFREHQVYVRDLPVHFPKATVTLDIAPDKLVTVVEGTLYNHKKDEYEYKVYIKENPDSFYYEDVYKVSPWILFRWSVSSGEVWGRGPAINALPTMNILNKLVAQLIYNNDMAITPPLIVDTSNSLLDIGSIAITPNSILPTKNKYNSGDASFKYLETGANFNVGENMRQQYHQQIQKMFHLHQIGSMQDSTKSATEINLRNQLAMSQQSAAFGRLQTELVTKIIRRVHYILSTYGITPSDIKIDDVVAKVEATGPLSRVQDQADVQALLNFMNTGMQMGESGMAMIASAIDTSKIGRYLATKSGVPAELLLSEEQQQVLAQQAQMAMMQQQQQPMPQEGEMPV